MAQQPVELRKAYQEYLRRAGLDLPLADHAPEIPPDSFARGSFDPKAAEAHIRLLEASRGYLSWPAVGTEPRVNYLERLATVRKRAGPYLGDRLPHLQEILDRMGPALLDVAQRAGTELPFDVFFGLNPTGEFNARVKPVAGGALVLMNAGTMDLLFSVLKANLAASGDDQDPPPLNDEQTGMVLAEAFNAYLYGEFSIRAWALPRLDSKREEFLWFVLRAGEQFMLAHELGHIARGHLRLPIGTGAPPEVRLTPETELEADEFALDLLARGYGFSKDDPRVQFLAGGMLNFLAIELTKSILAQEFQVEQVTAGTHPALKDRWDHLGKLLNERFPSADPMRRAEMFLGWLTAKYLGAIVAWLRLVDEVMTRPPKY